MVRPGRDRLFGCVEGDERYWGSEKEGVWGRSVPLREGSCVPQNYGMSRGALLGNCATEQKNRISGSWCVQTATAPALLLRNPLRTSKRPGSFHLGRCSLASLRSSSRRPPKAAAAAEAAEVAEDNHRASSQPTRITRSASATWVSVTRPRRRRNWRRRSRRARICWALGPLWPA